MSYTSMMSRSFDAMKIFLWCAGILFLPAHMLSQVFTSIVLSEDTVDIGDPFTVTIQISVQHDSSPMMLSFESWAEMENRQFHIDTVRLEPLADMEILDGGHWNIGDFKTKIPFDIEKCSLRNGKWETTMQMEAAIYNAGHFILTGPDILSDSTQLKRQSNGAHITVLWPSNVNYADSLSLNPIKDIFEEPVHWSDYTIHALIFLAVVMLIYLIYRFRKKANTSTAVTDIAEEVKRPAHDIALEALKSLADKRLWQQGQIKSYQTQLTSIIRQYLNDRYGINAEKMTTEDIILATDRVSLTDQHKKTLRQILNVADLVKFARALPEDKIHSEFMELSVRFVQDTREIIEVHQENNSER